MVNIIVIQLLNVLNYSVWLEDLDQLLDNHKLINLDYCIIVKEFYQWITKIQIELFVMMVLMKTVLKYHV
jgi:hypothetical protein